MKLLIVMDRLDESNRPTTKIAYNLAQELTQAIDEVHLLGPALKDWNPPANSVFVYHPFAVERPPVFSTDMRKKLDKWNGKPFSLFWKGLTLLIYPKEIVYFLKQGAIQNKLFSLKYRYKKAIEKQMKSQSFDKVLVIYFPHSALIAASELSLPCPLYLYQLDPWALMEEPRKESASVRIQQEKKAFQKATHIFTTPILLEQYQKTELKPYTSKMTGVEFPNIVPPGQNSGIPLFLPNKEGFTIVFTGTVVDLYRNPKPFLLVFEQLLEVSPQSRIFFIGGNDSEYLEQFALKYPESVYLLGKKTPMEARQAMEDADALLNLGNLWTNQIPSKLTDYISTGKPIIHTMKIPDCPSKAYLANYELCLCLPENSPPKQAAQRLLAFLERVKGKRLSFAEVEKHFLQATPKKVSETMLAILEDSHA